jgi:predicted nucleic acid-binding Zn ribbon protein
MAIIRCPECKQKVSTDCTFCPKCGADIRKARARQQKSSRSALWAFLVFILICFTVAFLKKDTSKTASVKEDVTVIEDVSQYSIMSVDDLVGKLGEPVSKESWTNKTTKGNFEVETYSYDINSNHYEFIIANNSVVRLTIYSDQSWNGKGNLFSFKNKKQIPSMFGIELSKDAKTKDNNLSYITSPVSARIAVFNVQDVDSKNKTFGFIKVTYSNNYFD